MELIFTMLGEAATTRIAKVKDIRGFPENKRASREGGTIAGNARKALERKSGQKFPPAKTISAPRKIKDF